MVVVDEVSEVLLGVELKNVQGFLEGNLSIGFFCTFGNLDSDCLQNSVQEGSKIIRKGVFLLQRKDLTVVPFFDGVIQQQDVFDVGILQVLDLDRG